MNQARDVERLLTWACALTGEQAEGQGPLILTGVHRLLATKLLHGVGQLVGLVGRRGVGKTRTLRFLEEFLSKNGKTAVAFKYEGGDILAQILSLDFAQDFYDEVLQGEIDERIPQSKLRKLLGRNFEEEPEREILKNLDRLEKLLPPKIRESCEETAVLRFLGDVHTLLIDMPDYPRRNLRQMARHIDEIQRLWFFLLNHDLKSNIVVTLQEETFKRSDHIFFGKMVFHRLEPFSPEQLVEYFEKLFPQHPFTPDALVFLAKLSLGVPRRFKRLINEVLANYLMENEGSGKIGVELVARVVTPELLAGELALELESLFISDRQRALAVRILPILLQNPDGFSQRTLANMLGVSEASLSRVLKVLRARFDVYFREAAALPAWQGGGQ
ncbi:MAG: hypothetical protein QXZ06_06995 [Candidatus Jordarchaeales archaeon]